MIYIYIYIWICISNKNAFVTGEKEKLYFHCGPSEIKTKGMNLKRGKNISIKSMGL